MKILIIAISVLSTIQSFGQEFFPGTYFTTEKDIGFESDIFQFEENGTFKYVFFTCTGSGLGRGKFEIIDGDSLRLLFTDCGNCEPIQKLETQSELSDSIEIDLKIKAWEDGSDILGASVFFPNARIGVVSNKMGQVKLTTAKFSEPQTLRIHFIGYDPVDIEIPTEYSKIRGTIYLTYNWVYGSSDVKTYKINKWTKSRLKLRRYPELSITYKRINPNKADDLIEDRMGTLGYKLYKRLSTPTSQDL